MNEHPDHVSGLYTGQPDPLAQPSNPCMDGPRRRPTFGRIVRQVAFLLIVAPVMFGMLVAGGILLALWREA